MLSKPTLIVNKTAASGAPEKRPSFGPTSQIALNPFLGTSAAIRELENRAIKLVNGNNPVLIEGEAGSGKGMLARWLHESGPRGEELQVQLSCTGVPQLTLEAMLFGYEKGSYGTAKGKPGLLEIAQGGSIFIEEIAEMDLHLQAKLLRVLDEKRFRRLGDGLDRELDVRVIASSSRNLAQRVQQDRFMKDLFARFGEPLVMPALRERVEDIAMLAAHLLDVIAAEQEVGQVDLPASVLQALQSSSWPGNVRQLRHTLERAVHMNGPMFNLNLHRDQVMEAHAVQPRTFQTLDEVERQYIQEVLSLEGGKVQMAARRLGIPRSSLYHKLKQYGMSRRSSEPRWNQTATGD